jgi:RsiW-degrading membrane proteinase PrsW (M82 family)
MDHSEWWQRAAGRAQRWSQAHAGLVDRLRRVRTIWLWACLAWLLVLVAFRSELREALSVSIAGYWLLLTWFWLARTKTVSWRLVATLYSACLLWSIAVAFITHALARQSTARSLGTGLVLAGNVNDLGPATLIAGVGEESAKLLPLAVLALLAAGRVRRFAVVDWLLTGFAAGLAFQISEELARRTAIHVTTPGLLDILTGIGNRGPDSGYPQYSWSPFGGWSQWTPGTQWPGHHVTTALVAVGVGLGVAAWRHAQRSRSAVIWRVLAVLLPVLIWWLVVSVHAGGNATSAVQDRWLTAAHPSMPMLIRLGWRVAHHGVGLRWLLPVLLLVALIVDARHLRAADEGADGPVLAVPFAPAVTAGAWSSRFLGPAADPRARSVAGSILTLAAYLTRDLQFLLSAHVPRAGESRPQVIARGRAAMTLLRQAREQGLARLTPPARAGRTRLLALGSLAVLLVALFWLGPHWAHQVGTSPTAQGLAQTPPAEWFARLLDALGQWWSGLSPGAKIAVGAGIAALVVLSGGSLGLALGVSGAGTYVLGHSRGAADFVTDPAAATRSYLAHTTPLGLVADTGEAVLTFLPGNFAGAAGGMAVRNGLDLYLRNPEAWWAAQRTLGRGDAGVIDLGAFLRRDPIALADGSNWPALAPDERTAMQEWWDSLPTSKLNATGPEGRYQSGLYGNTERIVTSTPKKTIADGATIDYGAIADAKFRVQARSWYDPASLNSDKLAAFAQQDMDLRLAKYGAVLNDPGTPAQVLEIATNDPAAAAFIESRLRALNIPGYVRLEP